MRGRHQLPIQTDLASEHWRPASPTPSPLNGERAGVRGEAVRLSRFPLRMRGEAASTSWRNQYSVDAPPPNPKSEIRNPNQMGKSQNGNKRNEKTLRAARRGLFASPPGRRLQS